MRKILKKDLCSVLGRAARLPRRLHVPSGMVKKCCFFCKLMVGPLLVLSLVHGASGALNVGVGHTPFWLGVQANQQIDRRVARLLAEKASMVVMRLRLKGPSPGYDTSAVVDRIQRAEASLPVLLYTWGNRYLPEGRSGEEIMGWLAEKPEMQIRSYEGERIQSFGDVTRKDFRREAIRHIKKALTSSRADGVAVDLAIRSPRYGPRALRRRCLLDPDFCNSYGQGMDALFAELRSGLGLRPVIYNGLWNLGPGMLSDQRRLLIHTDGAIIEYFGMNPRRNASGFDQHILPFLREMQHLPEGKNIFVFGRGPWSYTSYAQDYLWQRYLYCAYLLAKRNHTFFKYHATFQIPVFAGRSGGLDLYADWDLFLGKPTGAYRITDGMYTRSFEHGLAVLNPDGRPTVQYRLKRDMYSPEGKRYAGHIELEPGSGLLLLDQPPAARLGHLSLKLKPLASWQSAMWKNDGDVSGGYLALSTIERKALQGEHDLLLDGVHSLEPYATVDLELRPRDDSARILMVAEVDDPGEQQAFVAISLNTAISQSVGRTITPPWFRCPDRIRTPKWPLIRGPELVKNTWRIMEINGPDLLKKTRFRFRRWSHMRLEGQIDVRTIVLGSTIHLNTSVMK